MTKIKNQKDSW